MNANRTHKYRMYPNKKQVASLNQFLDCSRFVYNLLLDFNIKKFESTKKNLQISDLFKMLAALKIKHGLLRAVPQEILDSAVVVLNSDLRSFQKKNGSFPPFLSKNKDNKAAFLKGFNLIQQQNRVYLIGLGNVRYANSRTVGAPKSVTVSLMNGRWFLSVLSEIASAENSESANDRYIGIDVGLKEFAFLSNGVRIPNPKFYRSLEDKLIFEQRKLSRMDLKSNNWKKQLSKIQKLHESVHNSRINFLHKLSSLITDKYDVIGIEKLSIKDLARNKNLSKSIHDASWGIFINMLKYKARSKYKHLIEVERYFPSSQICSVCSHRQFMPLHLRTFECKNCGSRTDRDYNASINIERRAKELFLERSEPLGKRG